mmetsp:Transcript_58561/g.153860  ORF Transcript_58561/g.153860 Transcript_58561/m.153860 type:complete len:202 (-) Transcript_58561:50-655(-)
MHGAACVAGDDSYLVAAPFDGEALDGGRLAVDVTLALHHALRHAAARSRGCSRIHRPYRHRPRAVSRDQHPLARRDRVHLGVALDLQPRLRVVELDALEVRPDLLRPDLRHVLRGQRVAAEQREAARALLWNEGPPVTRKLVQVGVLESLFAPVVAHEAHLAPKAGRHVLVRWHVVCYRRLSSLLAVLLAFCHAGRRPQCH